MLPKNPFLSQFPFNAAHHTNQDTSKLVESLAQLLSFDVLLQIPNKEGARGLVVILVQLSFRRSKLDVFCLC